MFPAALLALLDPVQPAWYERPELAYPIYGTAACLLLALLASAGRIASWWRARGKQGVLDPVSAEEMLMTNAPLILDIREPHLYKNKLGHIRGALPMPYAEVGKRLEEMRTKEPRPIIVVDLTDERAYIIADYLRSKGFDWVYILKGGLKAWKRARLPLYH